MLSSAKPLRSSKGESKPRMQEAAAANKTFAQIFTEHDTVNSGKIGNLAGDGAGRGGAAILAGIRERVADTFGRRRMRGQKVRCAQSIRRRRSAAA